MAQSPFESNHTIFLLFGLADDHFCLPDTRLVDLSTYLDIHLRSIGFERLAFHHPLNGVQPPEPQPPAAPSRSTPRASGGKSLVGGPLGQMKMLSSSAPPRTPQPEPKTSDRMRMPDSELPSFIQSFFEGDELQAFIFEQFEYLMDFNREAVRTLWALLRDIQTQSTGKEKIIFLSNSRSTDLLENFQNNQHFLWSFKDHFFDQSAVCPGVIRIGHPGSDEILNFQRRIRLRNHVPTNFSSLVQNCETNATELRQETDPVTFSLKNNSEGLGKYDWTKNEYTESALNRLEALPGLSAVAERIRSDVDYAQHQQHQQKNGQAEEREQRDQKPAVERLLDHSDKTPPVQVNLNYALSGNPGTGKTITARLIAEAFKEAGILRSGHFIEATVQDLVGGYVGQSAIKANDLLSRARGGVLFIDEVQGFEKDNQFHREAIRTILKYAEDYRGDISVIVATYPGEMDAFLSIDQGLSRRFSQRIDLEDYDAATCVDIFNYMAAEKNLEVDPDLQKILEGFFNTYINDRTKKESEAFSNAGSVRNLIEEMDRARYSQGGGNTLLSLDDVPEEYHAYSEAAARSTGDPDARLEHALEELNALTGLTGVKEAVEGIVNGIKGQRRRGQEETIVPGHYSFEGNPGTGKTTVARLLGNIFRELGVLKSGHVVEVTRSHLVGEYMGQTAPKVREQTDKAMDGVLFIDEAHNLIQGERDEFGREAIGELTAILENKRERLCVIVAGYPEPMTQLFEADPGWKSRFTNRIHFEDYEPPEIAQIMRQMCAERKFTLHRDLDENLQPILARLRDVKGRDFANGRSVRNFFGNMVGHLDERLSADKEENMDPHQLILEDVPEKYQDAAVRRIEDPDERLERALKELNALTGLATVKKAVRGIVNGIKVVQLTGEESTIVPGHYSFEGNPGTGKTTVARLLGNIFRELGVLKSGHVVEVTRSHLVGEYMGQTAPKVREQTDKAMNGVLFIDEAHNLMHSNRDGQWGDEFGKEAIGELTAILENERARLCVIFAGYPEPIARLFNVDPGWESRISNRIHFEDYEPPEIAQIMRQMCKEGGFTLHVDLEKNLVSILARLRKGEGNNFANGRSVRNFFGRMKTRRNSRLIANEDDVKEGKIDPFELILEDVPEALRP